MFKKLSPLVALLFGLTSCASIMTGSKQKIAITSNPCNANIWVDQQCVGQTPLVVNLTRNSQHIIRLELDGYQPYQMVCSRELNGWVFGNIIFGGLIGLAVDGMTGALYKLTPEQVHGEFRQHNTVYSKRSSDASIFIVLEADPSWEKIGNLVAAN